MYPCRFSICGQPSSPPEKKTTASPPTAIKKVFLAGNLGKEKR